MSQEAPSSSSDRRILVVDDEARLAMSLAALLRGVGYNVEAATSGPDGLAKIRETPFDLVITDLRMDTIDGFDIMHHVASHCPNTALIVITGHASTESAIEALHQRVADYITKPFEFDFLRGSIEKVFARQEADRLRRDLVSMLSHDIKVPLSSVLGFARLIVQPDGSVSPRAGECAEYVVTNCQRILAMLDNYLTNTRLEEGKLDTLLLPVDPRDTIEELVTVMGPEFRRKGLSLKVELDSPPEGFQADEPLLCRAVANLMSNAAKYTPQGGAVVVRLKASTGAPGVEIEVTNSGCTLEESALAGIFERYTRRSSARGIEGSGLGLHIVRSIAEAHGGRAYARLLPGDWIAFGIRLPLNPEV
ncbi:response regulator [bacterium]|nr:response regulator [bacterium]